LQATAHGVQLPRQYLAVDLAELSRACDCRVDGLLGADFFVGRVVQIDFASQKIRLLASAEASRDGNKIPMKVRRNALLVAVEVNEGKPQWMRVDTGCTSALQWVVSQRKFEGGNSAELSVALTELNISSTRTRVKLGSALFESVPTGLHRESIFTGECGLVGNGLLSRFERLTFDTRAGQLVLEGRHARW
jgi:hypothetical protein